MPSIAILEKEYKVSRITIVGALKLLKESEYIEQKRGSGTYVKWRKEDVFFPFLNTGKKRAVEITHSLLGASSLHRCVMQLLADCFMKNYTDVSVRFVEFSNSTDEDDPYIQKILRNDTPVCGEFFWHAIYAKLNALIPLEHLEGFEKLKETLIPQATYPTTDGDGEPHIHAINFNIDLPSFLAINRRWAEKIDVHIPDHNIGWPVILRLFRHANRASISQIQPGGFPIPFLYHGVKSYIEMMGQDVLDSTFNPNSIEGIKKIVFSESAKLTLEYLKEIADAKQPWYMQDKLCEHFALGKIGILPFASSWNQCLYSYLKAKEPVFVSDMPSFKKGNAYRHFYSGFSLGIFRAGVLSEKQLYAAWNWLKFLFCVFPQELCSQSMTLPMRNDASPYISNIYPDIYHLSKHSLTHSQPQPDFVGMRNVYSLIGNAIRQFQLRKTGINETLERMQNSVCQSIGKTGRDYFTQNS